MAETKSAIHVDRRGSHPPFNSEVATCEGYLWSSNRSVGRIKDKAALRVTVTYNHSILLRERITTLVVWSNKTYVILTRIFKCVLRVASFNKEVEVIIIDIPCPSCRSWRRLILEVYSFTYKDDSGIDVKRCNGSNILYLNILFTWSQHCALILYLKLYFKYTRIVKGSGANHWVNGLLFKVRNFCNPFVLVTKYRSAGHECNVVTYGTSSLRYCEVSANFGLLNDNFKSVSRSLVSASSNGCNYLMCAFSLEVNCGRLECWVLDVRTGNIPNETCNCYTWICCECNGLSYENIASRSVDFYGRSSCRFLNLRVIILALLNLWVSSATHCDRRVITTRTVAQVLRTVHFKNITAVIS